MQYLSVRVLRRNIWRCLSFEEGRFPLCDEYGQLISGWTMAEMDDEKETRWLAWLRAPIDTDQHLLEFELTALALSTGIIDAVSFPKFHCFVSNQTGNTVLFAVTAFSPFGTRQDTNFTAPAAHLAVSLGFFCLGVFTPGQTSSYLGCRSKKWWLLLTNAVQTAFVLIAALINLVNRTPNYETDDLNSATILCSIGLLAFASGAQVAMSRQLGMPEIPTTQATAAYVDLFVDPNFFAAVTGNRSRNRRIAFLLTLVVGSFVGAPAYHYVSTAFAILLAGIIKIIVALSFLLNRSNSTRILASGS
ncbi:Histone-lysine N-methyltransferase [Lecanosticta acicola]|uniref:Histone-lysine N-methyltransferase n=1 Tax=Lecanosticta acicola TaxID=111012 RepID=A0AAI9E919_9PEZI|nr:Histone-lysine N-methyltransferase [Lecanosticta acicola]